jgi:hypothetical protein
MMLGTLIHLANTVRSTFLGEIGADIKLAMLAFALFGFTYLILFKAIIALEFAQDPYAFVP